MLHHLRIVVPAAAAAVWALQRLLHAKGGEQPPPEATPADQASAPGLPALWGGTLGCPPAPACQGAGGAPAATRRPLAAAGDTCPLPAHPPGSSPTGRSLELPAAG